MTTLYTKNYHIKNSAKYRLDYDYFIFNFIFVSILTLSSEIQQAWINYVSVNFYLVIHLFIRFKTSSIYENLEYFKLSGVHKVFKNNLQIYS